MLLEPSAVLLLGDKTASETFPSGFLGDKAECCGNVEKEGHFLPGKEGDTHYHGHPGGVRGHVDTL